MEKERLATVTLINKPLSPEREVGSNAAAASDKIDAGLTVMKREQTRSQKEK
jgi:hypothetical protein